MMKQTNLNQKHPRLLAAAAACILAVVAFAAVSAGGSAARESSSSAKAEGGAAAAGAFTIADYRQWRGDYSQLRAAAPLSPRAGEGGGADDNAPNFDNFHNGGGVFQPVSAVGFLDLPAFAADAVNDGGGDAFANLYQRAQLGLLSSLEDALASQSEAAVLNNFAAVRKAQVNLQTELGGRKGHLGVNFIGALTRFENDHRAVGWQLRAYAGGEDSKGANAGVFMRHIRGNALYGVNLFADIEDGNYGNFLRYSIGGEVQNTIFALNANYYLPETEGRQYRGNIRAFSRRGFDANIRVSVRHAGFLKLRGDYYRFDGRYGAPEEKGFRYGVEAIFPPYNNLELGILYDSGAKQLGGNLSYTHKIGAPGRSIPAAQPFAVDLYSPVVREYSQRILTAAPPPRVSLDIMVVGIVTTAITTTATMATGGMTSIMDGAITETPQFSFSFMTARLASVQATVRYELGGGAAFFVVSTRTPIFVTLPPASTPRPHLVSLTGRDLNNEQVSQGGQQPIVITSSLLELIGMPTNFTGGRTQWTLTIVEGSEHGQSTVTTTTTMTIGTVTTTMAPITTFIGGITTFTTMTATTRQTTYATTFITLTTSAMGDPPSSFSRHPSSSFSRRRRGNLPTEKEIPALSTENDGDGAGLMLDSRFCGNVLDSCFRRNDDKFTALSGRCRGFLLFGLLPRGSRGLVLSRPL